ncbi:MAG: hypothetical protein ABL934_01730 [Lysobacteraceae bacterium]
MDFLMPKLDRNFFDRIEFEEKRCRQPFPACFFKKRLQLQKARRIEPHFHERAIDPEIRPVVAQQGDRLIPQEIPDLLLVEHRQWRFGRHAFTQHPALQFLYAVEDVVRHQHAIGFVLQILGTITGDRLDDRSAMRMMECQNRILIRAFAVDILDEGLVDVLFIPLAERHTNDLTNVRDQTAALQHEFQQKIAVPLILYLRIDVDGQQLYHRSRLAMKLVHAGGIAVREFVRRIDSLTVDHTQHSAIALQHELALRIIRNARTDPGFRTQRVLPAEPLQFA